MALTFSIVHEYAFVVLDENQCSVSEFIHEFDAPTGSDDICDMHCEYHHAYILSQYDSMLSNITKISEKFPYKENYNFTLNLEFIIPPIS